MQVTVEPKRLLDALERVDAFLVKPTRNTGNINYVYTSIKFEAKDDGTLALSATNSLSYTTVTLLGVDTQEPGMFVATNPNNIKNILRKIFVKRKSETVTLALQEKITLSDNKRTVSIDGCSHEYPEFPKWQWMPGQRALVKAKDFLEALLATRSCADISSYENIEVILEAPKFTLLSTDGHMLIVADLSATENTCSFNGVNGFGIVPSEADAIIKALKKLPSDTQIEMGWEASEAPTPNGKPTIQPFRLGLFTHAGNQDIFIATTLSPSQHIPYENVEQKSEYTGAITFPQEFSELLGDFMAIHHPKYGSVTEFKVEDKKVLAKIESSDFGKMEQYIEPHQIHGEPRPIKVNIELLRRAVKEMCGNGPVVIETPADKLTMPLRIYAFGRANWRGYVMQLKDTDE